MSAWPFHPLQAGAYGAVCADPPWSFRGYTEQLSNRDVQRHYSTLNLTQIAELPVNRLAAPDAHLFLWATGPHLPAAFRIIEAWGFRYSGMAFTWIKLKKSYREQLFRMGDIASDLHTGLGFTTRKNAEFCLLARRGNCRRSAKDVREIILAPVREHSRKPEEFRERVERYVGPGIRIAELFSRESRPGWDSWGFEAGKYDRQK